MDQLFMLLASIFAGLCAASVVTTPRGRNYHFYFPGERAELEVTTGWDMRLRE